MVVISLLLCGAGTMHLAAAPAMPAEDDRAAAPAAAAPTVDVAAPEAPQAPAAPDDSITLGAWGWWKFDETTGTTAADASAHDHPGMLGGDGAGEDIPVWKPDETAPTTMIDAGSVWFDGDNDWISVAPGPTISSQASFSLVAWVKWEKGKSAIFWQGNNTQNQGLTLGIDINTSYPNIGILTCSFWNNDLTYTLPNPKAWHHVACTADYNYDGAGHNRRRLYVDGAQVNEDFPTSWYTGSGELWIGKREAGTWPWHYGGTIDEAGVYARALTAAEVRTLAAQPCLAQPVRPNGQVEPTIPSPFHEAVQQAVDALGAAGGTVRISGVCAGVDGGGALIQTVQIPSMSANATMTLEGGWDSSFTAHDPILYNTVLDAQGAGRVVYAPEGIGALVIKDLTLTNGDSSALPNEQDPPIGSQHEGSSGGALRTRMVTTLTNVYVTNNRAGYSGGGIRSAATLTMTDCTVSDNETGFVNPSSGYWNASGGGISASGTLNMTNCTVTGNTATIGESAQGFSSAGGGIFTNGDFTLTNCQVTDNTAYMGGGLLVNGHTGTISGSTFSGNTATSGTYTGNDDNGGAIHLVSGALTLTNSAVLGNSAERHGGGIYMGGGTLTVNGGKIGYRNAGEGNTATGDGGGVYQLGGTATLNSTVLVYGNTAVNGAGLYDMGGALSVTSAQIGSTASGEGNVASANGGGVYVSASGTLQMSTTGATIVGNRAAQGAGVYVYGGAMTTTAGSITSNTATTAGGGIYIAAGSVTLGSTSTSFNSAPNGAGLYVALGTVAVTGSTIGYNTAAGTGAGTYYGGGAYVSGTGTLTLTGATLVGNTATSGGGMHVAGGTATLDATTIVRHNSAPTGGGLSVAGGTLTATGTTIGGTIDDPYDWNQASTLGGGAYVSGTGALNLTSVTLSDNFAGVNGGGLHVAGGTATVSGSTISSSTSAYGGGVCTTGGTTTITNSTIASNTASISGGGVYAYGGTLTVTGGAIHHNTATGTTGTGGGAGTGGTGTMNLNSLTIRDNTAPDGAGLYTSAGTLNVSNSTISANTATATGGGGRVEGGTVKLNLTTVTENQAPQGAGLYAGAGTTKPTSSIIAKNRTATDVYGGDVKAVAGLTSGGGNVIGVGDVTAFTAQLDRKGITDPGLETLGADGTHHLVGTSVAVDNGLCTIGSVTYTTDQLGHARPGGGGTFCDSGAYELQVLPVNCAAKSGRHGLTGPNARIVQQMVDQVTAGATVKVAGHCTGVAGSDPWTLVINKSLTMEGGYSTADDEPWTDPDPVEHPTVLDALSLGGVVHISTSNTDVTLRYLTITGGQRSWYAGVLANTGTRVNVEYCTITNNHATTNRGGGVGAVGQSMNLVGSLVQNNSANDDGQGVGGGVYVAGSGAATIANNTFIGNSAHWGGAVANVGGDLTLRFNTIKGNTTEYVGASLYLQSSRATRVAANIFASPTRGHCSFLYSNVITSGGFNYIADGTCILGDAPAGRPDVQNATFELGELDFNGGKTKNYLPEGTVTNPILDVIPVNACDELLGTAPLDQRGRLRPSLGWETHENWCDPGSVERGKEILAVCGPPLDMSDNSPRSRCRYLSVAQAMKTAADGDIIVVSGVITENVTLNKDVTLRGPMPDWNTPGTHMGFVQGATAKPDSACTGDTVVNVPAGSTVTIEDLNIRYGCATDGGGIKNEGTLNLVRSTVYDNRASAGGGGIYNAGTLTVADSTLSGNAAADGGGIYNAASAVLLTVRRSTFAGNTASASGQSIANLDTDLDAATMGGSILRRQARSPSAPPTSARTRRTL